MPIKNRRTGNSRYGPRLARILSPMAVSEFLGKYFNRKPLFIRGRPGKFDFMFKADELMKHLDQVTEITAVFPLAAQAPIRPADIRVTVKCGGTVFCVGRGGGQSKPTAVSPADEPRMAKS